MRTALALCVVVAALAAPALASPGDQALAWEAQQFKEHAAPYAGECLGFVKAAYASAGVSADYLNQGSAKEGYLVAKTKSGFNTGGTPPLGAVLFWENCSQYGHAALSRGGGYASSSGTGTNWNGSPNVAISWLDNNWIVPYSTEETPLLRGSVAATA